MFYLYVRSVRLYLYLINNIFQYIMLYFISVWEHTHMNLFIVLRRIIYFHIIANKRQTEAAMFFFIVAQTYKL